MICKRSASHRVIVEAVTIEIVMPYWGDVDLFKTAVESVRAQSDPDWRLTIIDDAYPSTEPEQWVRRLADARIHYLRNERNVGVNANFQRAIELASEDRLTIFGCDDVLLPEYVARVRGLAAEHDADIIQPGTKVIDEHGVEYLPLADRVKSWIRPRFHGSLELSGEPLAKSLSRGDWMYFPALSWKTERLKQLGFRANYLVVLDLALALDLAMSGGSLVVDDQVVFGYRRHQASVSSWRAVEGSRFTEEREYLLGVAEQFDQLGWHAAAREARLRLTSRLNAVVALPKALASGQWAAVRSLGRHAFGR